MIMLPSLLIIFSHAVDFISLNFVTVISSSSTVAGEAKVYSYGVEHHTYIFLRA